VEEEGSPALTHRPSEVRAVQACTPEEPAVAVLVPLARSVPREQTVSLLLVSSGLVRAVAVAELVALPVEEQAELELATVPAAEAVAPASRELRAELVELARQAS
jgi:hypothetical protein